MSNEQQLPTGLVTANPLTVRIDPGAPKSVLIMGQVGHAMVVRKDISVCGGGNVQLVDSVLLPYAM